MAPNDITSARWQQLYPQLFSDIWNSYFYSGRRWRLSRHLCFGHNLNSGSCDWTLQFPWCNLIVSFSRPSLPVNGLIFLNSILSIWNSAMLLLQILKETTPYDITMMSSGPSGTLFQPQSCKRWRNHRLLFNWFCIVVSQMERHGPKTSIGWFTPTTSGWSWRRSSTTASTSPSGGRRSLPLHSACQKDRYSGTTLNNDQDCFSMKQLI